MKVSRLLLSMALLPACKGDKKAAEPPPAQTPAQAPAADQPATPAEPKPAAISKGRVQGVVQTWLDTQNQNDFEGYSAAYAKRMTGIKRVGSRSMGYDRSSWLKDRGRMFKKKMVVIADDIEVHTTPSSAKVRFRQTWSSGKFKDVGPKQLILVLEEGKLRIAREEMLSSAVLSSKRNPSGLLEGLVFAAPGVDAFILQMAEEGWGKGEPDVDGADPYIGTRDVAMDALPPELRAVVGKTATVYGEGGACSSKATGLNLVVGLTPHFGYFQDEEGEQRDVGDEEMAQDLFGMGTPYLVATLDGKCSGGIAQLEGKRKVVSLASVKDEEMSAKLHKAFAALPDNKELQEQYEAEANEDEIAENPTGNWDDQGELSLFHDASGNRHLAVVSASGGVGCGGFYGSLSAVFQIGVDGKVQLLGTIEQPFHATAAFDLNGDGRIEFEGMAGDMVSEESGILGISEEGKYDILHSFGWEYHDCPC